MVAANGLLTLLFAWYIVAEEGLRVDYIVALGLTSFFELVAAYLTIWTVSNYTTEFCLFMSE